jgi:hypothetical protein
MQDFYPCKIFIHARFSSMQDFYPCKIFIHARFLSMQDFHPCNIFIHARFSSMQDFHHVLAIWWSKENNNFPVDTRSVAPHLM